MLASILILILSGCGMHREAPSGANLAEQRKVYTTILDSLYGDETFDNDSVTVAVVVDSSLVMDSFGGSFGGVRVIRNGKPVKADRVLGFAATESTSALSGFRTDTLVSRFNRLNSKSVPIDTVRARTRVRRVSFDAIKQMFNMSEGDASGWNAFYKTYPGSNGYVRLTQVAFDDSLTQALVYWEVVRGYVSGTGEYIFLRKFPFGWQIQFRLPNWVS
jgi:hypothetical protein